jgi:hypothetical protein
MSQGPSLIFDKSSLESLNIHEAALMDNFYMSTITPLFFVECLADLEKQLKSGSTPEQLIGSLADRTPDSQGYPNVHHIAILNSELTRQFDIKTVYERVAMAHGEPVQLGDKKGVVYRKSKEQEALERWTKRQFLDVERNMAKQWRRSLTAVDFDAMVKHVMRSIGPWRAPKTLEDAKQLADTIIDYLDTEWLLRFGLDLLGLPEAINVPNAADIVIADWIQRRRPPLREHVPYFVFLLTVNIFFCLVLSTPSVRLPLSILSIGSDWLPFSVICKKCSASGSSLCFFAPSFRTVSPISGTIRAEGAKVRKSLLWQFVFFPVNQKPVDRWSPHPRCPKRWERFQPPSHPLRPTHVAQTT